MEPDNNPVTVNEEDIVEEMFELEPRKQKVVEEFYNEQEREYYNKASNYWSTIQPTVDGMLGGFGNITATDVRGSQTFLQGLFRLKPAPERKFALDCGSGIGRVTKNLLLPLFESVDMVEQEKQFCDQARMFVCGREEPDDSSSGGLRDIYNVGLQDFEPDQHKYDVIWSQWVLGHLKDCHLIEFLQKCVKGLKNNGVIVIKENFTSSGEIDIDVTDNSVTRPLKHMKELIEKANLRIIREHRQTNFPKGLYPVYILALKSKNKSS